MLNRDQILGADDRKVEPVECPEWGGTVYVRSLSGAERDALELTVSAAFKAGGNAVNARARFAAAFLSDDKGGALFTDVDVEALGNKSAVALERVWNAGQRLNGIGEAAVEALAKN